MNLYRQMLKKTGFFALLCFTKADNLLVCAKYCVALIPKFDIASTSHHNPHLSKSLAVIYFLLIPLIDYFQLFIRQDRQF